MATTDIVTIGGGELIAAGFLGRDCAFPVMKLRKTIAQDDVLRQMPVFVGRWAPGTTVPVLLTQDIDVDTTVVVDDCDVAEVSGELSEGTLTAPDQAKIKLGSKRLQIDELVPAFCRSRNILSENQRLLNANGTINVGNAYAVDFARYAYAQVARALQRIISHRILRGDASMDFGGLDGMYTQIDNGWDIVSASVPVYLNKATVLNWQTVTGGASAMTPDDLTIAAQTLSLWNVTVDIPADYNLAKLLERFYIPAVERMWTEAEGGVDAWEMHVPLGMADCLIESAACIQPCGDSVVIDLAWREFYANLVNSRIVRLYPSGKQIAILESRHVPANTIYFGPRSIGGSPTYAVVFRNMDQMFSEIGWIGDTYAQRTGLPADNEPLLSNLVPDVALPFESRVIHTDAEKVSIDCVKFSAMAILGVLVTDRHLWLKITNITCSTWVAAPDDEITIDGAAITA